MKKTGRIALIMRVKQVLDREGTLINRGKRETVKNYRRNQKGYRGY